VAFLIVADAPQSLIANLSDSQIQAYFADRKLHGFNAAMVMLLCSDSVSCKKDGAMYDGVRPFLAGNSPLDYDLSAPNPAYFARVDRILGMAAANGIVVFLDPIETSGWLKTLEHNGPTKAFKFGSYIGSRYSRFGNIMWMNGNDFQSWRTNRYHNELIRQVMAGIAQADKNHLQTIELDFLRSYSSEDRLLAPYLGINGVYTYYETYDSILQASRDAKMPVVLLEANYEFEHNGSNTDGGSLSNLRRQEYWTLLSGGAGHIYGNRYTWTSSWVQKGNLVTPGVTQVQYSTALLVSLPWWNLIPDQQHQVVIAGYGTYRPNSTSLSTADYCTTAWIPDGSAGLSYCPTKANLRVAMDRFKSAVNVRWFDPTNGTFVVVDGSPFQNRGSRNFSTPGFNADGSYDWVLVIESVSERKMSWRVPFSQSRQLAVNFGEHIEDHRLLCVRIIAPEALAQPPASIVGSILSAEVA
jgi:hypothetical protein